MNNVTRQTRQDYSWSLAHLLVGKLPAFAIAFACVVVSLRFVIPTVTSGNTFRTSNLLVDTAATLGSAGTTSTAATINGKTIINAAQLDDSPHASVLLTISGSNYTNADGGLQIFNSTGYDTTASSGQSFAIFASDAATVQTGGNTLTNHAIYATAANGSTNYSGLFDNGFFRVNGESLLTNVDASNIVDEGYLQVNGTSDFEGHLFVPPSLPPALSACGDGTAQIVGDDIAGFVHIGAGATSCTLTFNSAFPTRPACIVQNENGNDNIGSYTVSSTQIVYTVTGLTSGQDFDYMCIGIRNAPHMISRDAYRAKYQIVHPPRMH